jgi:pimeloyl-ACP methyl ester carboxylesterase
VLLPGEGENRLLWDKSSAPRDQEAFPLLLQKRGYAVITVDLRQHGESKIPGREDPLMPNDYQAMVLGDMVAVKDFIFTEHQAQRLNMQKMGIVAIGPSVPVAAAFTEFDWSQRPYDDAPLASERTPRGQDVKALVFLSPETSAGRVKATTAMKFIRKPIFNIALQVIVGAADPADKRQADSVYQAFATLDKEHTRTELLTPDVKDRGIALVRVPIVYVSVLKFLDAHLKGLDIPWQDRRSRLER